MRAEDRVRVCPMIDAAEAVGQYIAGRQRQELDRDHMLLFAIVRAIEVIGEASAKVSAETRAAFPAIPWSAIVSMRNRLIHRYFDIDTELVWVTATQEVVALLGQLRPLVTDRD
jgi:uncharacterized protein with HEPN domain